MNIKQLIENNTTLSILSILLVGFLAGAGVYKFILETAQLDTVRKGTYLLKDKIGKDYISLNKIDTKFDLDSLENKEDNASIRIIKESVVQLGSQEDSSNVFNEIKTAIDKYDIKYLKLFHEFFG